MTADWGEHWERIITGHRSYWLRKGHDPPALPLSICDKNGQYD